MAKKRQRKDMEASTQEEVAFPRGGRGEGGAHAAATAHPEAAQDAAQQVRGPAWRVAGARAWWRVLTAGAQQEVLFGRKKEPAKATGKKGAAKRGAKEQRAAPGPIAQAKGAEHKRVDILSMSVRAAGRAKATRARVRGPV